MGWGCLSSLHRAGRREGRSSHHSEVQRRGTGRAQAHGQLALCVLINRYTENRGSQAGQCLSRLDSRPGLLGRRRRRGGLPARGLRDACRRRHGARLRSRGTSSGRRSRVVRAGRPHGPRTRASRVPGRAAARGSDGVRIGFRGYRRVRRTRPVLLSLHGQARSAPVAEVRVAVLTGREGRERPRRPRPSEARSFVGPRPAGHARSARPARLYGQASPPQRFPHLDPPGGPRPRCAAAPHPCFPK
jgi:hypothetical protein